MEKKPKTAKWEKRPIDSILEDSQNIDVDVASIEILEWFIGNVENFIDNTQKIFRFDLVLDNKEMPELKKLQDLYRAIPDDEEDDEKQMDECSECRRELDKITKEIYEKVKSHTELLDALFKRMVYYYERLIMTPENKTKAFEIDDRLKTLIDERESLAENKREEIQERINAVIEEGMALIKYSELEGSVDVVKFEYEAFDVEVQIGHGVQFDEKGLKDKDRAMRYTIPEGFVCYIEIAYHNKFKPVAMF